MQSYNIFMEKQQQMLLLKLNGFYCCFIDFPITVDLFIYLGYEMQEILCNFASGKIMVNIL